MNLGIAISCHIRLYSTESLYFLVSPCIPYPAIYSSPRLQSSVEYMMATAAGFVMNIYPSKFSSLSRWPVSPFLAPFSIITFCLVITIEQDSIYTTRCQLPSPSHQTLNLSGMVHWLSRISRRWQPRVTSPSCSSLPQVSWTPISMAQRIPGWRSPQLSSVRRSCFE